VRLDEVLLAVFIVLSVAIAVFLARKHSAKPHGMLTRLVAANIVLDILAIGIWGAFPATQWSIYRLNFLVVGTEAAAAATLFALTLFGLTTRKKWAPILAIAVTVTQRAFAAYVFFNYSNLIPLAWSLLIIYFAYKETKNLSLKPLL
jgi:hypothetical protein